MLVYVVEDLTTSEMFEGSNLEAMMEIIREAMKYGHTLKISIK